MKTRLGSAKREGRPLLLAQQQGALALCAPAIAGERAILLHDTVTRDEDRNAVASDRLGHFPRVARAERGSDGAVARGLPRRDAAHRGPHPRFVVCAPRIELQLRITIGTIDER